MKPANYAPIYACVYAQLAEVTRSHGYALAAHGSLAADFDLVCVPWVPEAGDPQSVVDEITSIFSIKQIGSPEPKEHGRIAYTISFEFGECRLDLSFMPRAAATLTASAPSHGEQVRESRSEFQREERYMVVKLSKLSDDLGDDELSREEQIYRLAHFGKALVECVVVESDWPEYGPTWAAIEARVTGVEE